ncbi:MAG: MFS transporter [Acidimicrobiales bacterium]
MTTTRVGRVAILAPLRHRDFRLLWTGLAVSLLGDGIFLVAVAWEAYRIEDRPSALAGVGLAASVPQVVLLLFGGAVSDRLPRKLVLITADAARALAVGSLTMLSSWGHLRLWELWAVAFVIGAATAFAAPAFDSIVPAFVPKQQLMEANGLDQFMRPAALQLLGPALGGVLLATVGAAGAFGADALSFVFSGFCVARLSSVASVKASRETGSLWVDIGEGLRYVRSQVWLWGTFVAATFTYLLFLGPTYVLVPYLVKNRLHGSAATLGIVLGLGGLGALSAAVVTAQVGDRGRRPITFLYAAWTAATLLVAGYGLVTLQWQLAALVFLVGALEAAGTVVWATLKQRLVPGQLLGRVSSIDWFVSTALMPLSYVLTPIVVRFVGVSATFELAGTLGAVVTFGFLFLPGMRTNDRPATQPKVVRR